MMGRDVDEVAAALVREYLSRKGLKKTIACMDEELPRTSLSISNRSELCKVLHLESLYKKNKSEAQPFKSLLEIMTKERMRKTGEAKKRQVDQTAEADSPKLSADPVINEAAHVKRDEELTEPNTDSLRLSESSSARSTHNTKSTAETELPAGSSSTAVSSDRENNTFPSLISQDAFFTSRTVGLSSEKRSADGPVSRSSRMRRGVLLGPVATSCQDNTRRRPARKTSARSPPITKNYDDSGLTWMSRSGSVDAVPTRSDEPCPPERGSSTSLSIEKQNRRGDGLDILEEESLRRIQSACDPGAAGLHMVLDDINDEDLSGISGVSQIKSSLHQMTFNKRPMDLQTATELKELMFGSPMACFNMDWKCQSFTFSNVPALRYGIVQKKGGPCGVLAAVQASVLQKLLFEGTGGDPEYNRTLQVSDGVRTKGLTEALAEILWRAGDRRNATVAINSGRSQFSPMGHYRSEGVLETITCVDVSSFEDLKQLIEEHIYQFESGPFGCILLVVSAVLSRTIRMVRGDMDVPTSTLIGAHGYCTQELVSLLLCGRAVSNVFDDEMKLDSGNGNFTLLKGIRGRCNIGLLSLFEHYNICKVGSNLKNPRFPIWTVCSESHFSVLFSLSKDLTSSRRSPTRFDLYYYDGLANQQEPIRLTVYPDSAVKSDDTLEPDPDPELTPPLELCIRTRWVDARVSWNDSEPIL